MRASNRLWRAIRRHVDEHDALVAKIAHFAHGKRHALTEIPLTVDEGLVVMSLLTTTDDDYLRFCVEHEREHNPTFPA
jgi:hypothetical protein